MGNGPGLKMYFLSLLKMGIFHCYVSLPDGTWGCLTTTIWACVTTNMGASCHRQNPVATFMSMWRKLFLARFHGKDTLFHIIICLTNLIRSFLLSFTISREYWRHMSSFETKKTCHLASSKQPIHGFHSALPVMSSTAKSRDLFVGWESGHPSPRNTSSWTTYPWDIVGIQYWWIWVLVLESCSTSPWKWWINECEQQSPALRSAEI